MAQHNLNENVNQSPGRETHRRDVDLSVICLLVSQRGGHIQVNESSPSGISITIFLPPPDASIRASDQTESFLPTPPDRYRVLVVDDDEALRRFAATILESAGFHVQEAQSGDEAIKLCELNPSTVDLILADVFMPKMSGRQLASHLESLCPNAKILLMSGFPNVTEFLSGIANRPEKSHSDEILMKPFTPSQLLQRVREALDQTKPAG